MNGNGHRDLVVLVLATGVSLAVLSFTFAVVYDALVNDAQAGISENATQVLLGALGGMIGVIGSYVGGRTAQAAADRERGAGTTTTARVPAPRSILLDTADEGD